ncbi:MAG: hypothetical protein KA411_05615 [Limnohabitans sp.]|jgi:hypothetical protein|nr:hypothetical protein [Limnohabitans sp.]
MVSIEYRSDRIDLFREHAQIQFGVALLDHASQQCGTVDASLGFIDGTAITPDFAHMASHALAVSDQFFAQLVIRILEDRWLCLDTDCKEGNRAGQKQRRAQFHVFSPIKKAAQRITFERQEKSHEYQSSFLNNHQF